LVKIKELIMRMFLPSALALTMIASSAFAATDSTRPLAAGKPANFKQAQAADNNILWWVLGAGVIVGGIALVASGSSNGNLTTGTLSTSSTGSTQ
jgi:hypothetical protein